LVGNHDLWRIELLSAWYEVVISLQFTWHVAGLVGSVLVGNSDILPKMDAMGLVGNHDLWRTELPSDWYEIVISHPKMRQVCRFSAIFDKSEIGITFGALKYSDSMIIYCYICK
jgi:hypothetical protein